MHSLFISDLHLNPQQPLVVEGFLSFLQGRARNSHRLYILGDFFDAWIGDDDDHPLALEIQEALRAYSTQTPTFFMRGNRDFLIGPKFAEQTGVTLLDDSALVDLGGRRALLMHGDTLCTEDRDYLEFRAMVRSPQWQAKVLALPLDQRRMMAADLREKSLSMNAIKAQDIMDVTPAEVERVMMEADVSLLIHGHTHRPAHHTLNLNGQPAERWVLGDWHASGWYISADSSGELELVEFPLAGA